MIRVDIYRYGSGWRARSHYHAAGADRDCNSECEDRALSRCYPDHRDTPKQVRASMVVAALLSLNDTGWSHQQFLNDVADEPTLY